MNDAHDNAATDREALERHRDTLTHAVTVPQPLAWALAAGHCPVLMSDTRPGLEHEGKLIGIHAHGKYFAPSALDDMEARLGRLMTAEEERAVLARGALIGVARLVGVVRAGMISGQFQRMAGRAVSDSLPAETCARIRSWWRSGSKWGLLLADAVLLPEPIPMRGAGGVWRIGAGIWAGSGRGCAPAALALEQWRKARSSR